MNAPRSQFTPPSSGTTQAGGGSEGNRPVSERSGRRTPDSSFSDRPDDSGNVGSEGGVEFGSASTELRETISRNWQSDDGDVDLYQHRSESELHDFLQSERKHRNGNDQSTKNDYGRALHVQSRRALRAAARHHARPVTLQYLKIQRDVPLSWGLMPQLLDRIYNFCIRYDADTPPQDARDAVRNWFSNGDAKLGLWAVYDETYHVRAHIWANPEPLAQEAWKYVLIRQVEAEGVTKLLSRQIFSEVTHWTKSIGLDRIVILTHRSAEAMARRWGFRVYKTLMDLSLEDMDGGRRLTNS